MTVASDPVCVDCGAVFRPTSNIGPKRKRCYKCSPSTASKVYQPACAGCSIQFTAFFASARWCSKTCKKKSENARFNYSNRRRNPTPIPNAYPSGFKTCRRCFEAKPLARFCRDSTKPDGLRRVCKECDYQSHKEWRHSNPDKYAAQSIARREGGGINRWTDWRRLNRDGYLKAKRLQGKRLSEALTDGVVRARLKAQGFSRQAIETHLIQLKREQLTMRRMARQLKKAINESSKEPR